MLRIFLDANVLFSTAYAPAGRAARFVAVCAADGHQLLCCDYAIDEARRNLAAKRPGALPELSAIVAGLEITAAAAADLCPVPIRDKDRAVLASAIAVGADLLVTGDLRDLGAWMHRPDATGGVRIVAMSDFLSEDKP